MQTELIPVQSIYIPICISNVLKQQLKVLRAGPAHTGIFYLNFTSITVRGLHIFQKLCSISAIQAFCSPILPEGAPEAHPCLPAGLMQGASVWPGAPTHLPQVPWNRALLPWLQHPSLSCCSHKDCIGKARLRAEPIFSIWWWRSSEQKRTSPSRNLLQFSVRPFPWAKERAKVFLLCSWS